MRKNTKFIRHGRVKKRANLVLAVTAYCAELFAPKFTIVNGLRNFKIGDKISLVPFPLLCDAHLNTLVDKSNRKIAYC